MVDRRAMNGGSYNMPYIKPEPSDDFSSNNNFMASNSHFNGQQHNNSVDPSSLSMENNYGMSFPYGSQNMSSSFNLGNSGIQDDELLDLDFNTQPGMNEFSTQRNSGEQLHSGSMPMNTRIFSNTPDGHPIQSPFLNHFDFNSAGPFRSMNSIPQHMSPHQGPQMMNKRPSLQTTHRKSSDQRSPMTPRTAAISNLHIGSPDPMNLQNGRPIRTPSMQQNRHSKTLSGQFDGTPGSIGSYLESPLSSPANGLPHGGIEQALGKHASLPAKVENGAVPQNLETQEAKKRRRRASHNAVERRRRDNINERIQDLSHLVPQHRLDDDRVRKQLVTQGPLSPTGVDSNMSPPNAATSLLAGANGRRAASTAGNITIGLPIEEKERGPNKGDILNGSVSWTRDLMWALHQKYVQEEELAQLITQLGGTWPFQITDEDRRMRSELMDAIERNDPTSFQYSRADGTGLRVPKFTTVAGEKIRQNSSSSPGSNFELSPGFQSGGSGAHSGSNPGQPQYWHSAGHDGISFKEEDEYLNEEDLMN